MSEQRGAAGAVAGASVIFFMTLGAVIVVLGWIGLTIYALVKAIGGGSDQPGATAIVLFFVLLVTALVTAFTASIGLIGRGMTPRKRRARETEQLAFDLPVEDSGSAHRHAEGGLE